MERIAKSERRELATQMLRYGAVGVGLAVLYAAVYWAGTALAAPPQMANGAGFVAALAAGYVLHSRLSFHGYGQRDSRSWGRFLAVNLAGYLLNCLWVWLIVDRLRSPAELAIVPIVTLTPAFTFVLNRRWTFA